MLIFELEKVIFLVIHFELFLYSRVYEGGCTGKSC